MENLKSIKKILLARTSPKRFISEPAIEKIINIFIVGEDPKNEINNLKYIVNDMIINIDYYIKKYKNNKLSIKKLKELNEIIINKELKITEDIISGQTFIDEYLKDIKESILKTSNEIIEDQRELIKNSIYHNLEKQFINASKSNNDYEIIELDMNEKIFGEYLFGDEDREIFTKHLVDLIFKYVPDNKNILYVGEKGEGQVGFTLNDRTKKAFFNQLTTKFTEGEGSDTIVSVFFTLRIVKLKTIKNKVKETFIFKKNKNVIKKNNNIKIIEDIENIELGNKQRNDGKFFKYLNISNFDLTRYDIYKEEKEENYIDNCLYKALKFGGLENAKLNYLKSFCYGREVPINKLGKICEKLNIKISLKYESNKNKNIYGEDGQKFELGLIDGHYFINEEINISNYCIENYKDVKDLKEPHLIFRKVGKYYERSKNNKSSSYTIIKKMLENKDLFFKNLNICDELLATPYSNKIINIKNLDYLPENMQLMEIKEQKIKEYDNIYFIDFEAYVSDNNNNYMPFMLCAVDKNDKKYSFTGPYCALNFFNKLKGDVLLIAHNMDFDARFLLKYCSTINEIERNNCLMGADAKFYNIYNGKYINIKLKCSYKLIEMKLEKFPSTFFNLEDQKEIIKEVMPYGVYNEKNIEQRYIKIDEALLYLKTEEDKKQFKFNLEKLNLINGDLFDCLEYSKFYCMRDCEVLKKGFLVFREWMLNLTKLDIYNIISISSLADKFLINEGVYDGIYEMSGVPQQFIMRCVIGGRTMTKNNEKLMVNERLSDFDAKSLYPSAMAQMGYLKGKPKILNTCDYEKIKNYDGYFIEINIKNVGIKRQFPQLSIIDKKGIRNFTNDLKDQKIFIDKIALEDAIKYQNIDFEIIRGYYFDEGFNYKIQEVMKNLFNERTIKQKAGNPAEIIYKLLMNSAYGKTLLKSTDTEAIYIKKLEKLEKYIDFNYNYIQKFAKVEGSYDLYRVKKYTSVKEHFNRCHIGASVLSMSKRIMSEVMTLAEDLHINIYYQDTDSMHITESKINLLESEFKKKYNRDLIGDNMGQFHSDFELKGAVKNITATRSIFLGKKSYFDSLEGENKNGEIIKGEHKRMKGSPQQSLTHYAKNNNLSVYEVYEKLFNNEELKFDLLCKDENDIVTNCKMIKNFNKSIQFNTNFIRTFKFIGERTYYPLNN